VDPHTIKALLLKRVKHPALVNLVGTKQFNQGVADVHELLQSEVFLQQVRETVSSPRRVQRRPVHSSREGWLMGWVCGCRWG
jgi:hypothetical protein